MSTGLLVIKGTIMPGALTIRKELNGLFNNSASLKIIVFIHFHTAVDKAQKYLNTKELPSSWKREEILGTPPSQPSAASTSGATSQQQSKQSSSAAGSAQSSDTDSVSVLLSTSQ